MFGVLRQLNIPKVSAGILRWSLFIVRLMGAADFRLKTSSDDQVMVEDSSLKWKWTFGLFRIGCQTMFMTMYFRWDVPNIELTEHFLHFMRLLLQFACCMSILRLQIAQGHEVTKLINNLLQLFRQVQDFCNGNRYGFGGKNEMVVLFFIIISLIHEEVFILTLIKPHWSPLEIAAVYADTYICFGIKMLIYYAFIIRIQYDVVLLCSDTVIEMLSLFLLTWSVQRAVEKSGEIRLIMLDYSNLIKTRNWHKTLELCYIELTVNELRVLPLGLFRISKELFMEFLSAMFCYLTFLIQSRIQLL
ncbi:putative gustatory receptor 92a [Drosophila biarmipes]|uniref:putative gustatory receptor 92a n=1 Tax=Drosophila biarmipes TaxID=125945 RepID=UPI0021CC5655|nr:putative gustatory receptor 92a [Drosophila biarmipes]